MLTDPPMRPPASPQSPEVPIGLPSIASLQLKPLRLRALGRSGTKLAKHGIQSPPPPASMIEVIDETASRTVNSLVDAKFRTPERLSTPLLRRRRPLSMPPLSSNPVVDAADIVKTEVTTVEQQLRAVTSPRIGSPSSPTQPQRSERPADAERSVEESPSLPQEPERAAQPARFARVRRHLVQELVSNDDPVISVDADVKAHLPRRPLKAGRLNIARLPTAAVEATVEIHKRGELLPQSPTRPHDESEDPPEVDLSELDFVDRFADAQENLTPDTNALHGLGIPLVTGMPTSPRLAERDDAIVEAAARCVETAVTRR